MGAFNPQKFVDPETLKRVSFKNLVLLLTTTANGYLFQKREDGKPARMALADEESAFDFDLLVDVLLTPEEGYPDELADALYHIAEVADSDGIHQLQDDLRDTLAVAELGDEPSHADLALHAWLKHRDAVERVMGRQFLLRPKSFITYLEVPEGVALEDLGAPADWVGTYEGLDGWDTGHAGMEDWTEERVRAELTREAAAAHRLAQWPRWECSSLDQAMASDHHEVAVISLRSQDLACKGAIKATRKPRGILIEWWRWTPKGCKMHRAASVTEAVAGIVAAGASEPPPRMVKLLEQWVNR